MDELKASWILEFVLRQPVEDWLAKELLFRLPIPSTLDPRLAKVLLLRRLSADLSFSRLSNETLQSLELLEELDRSLGAVVTAEALVAAYSAVAAELTAAPLRSGRQARFFECVNRIWNCRVADLEQSEARGLMGEGLRRWRKRMEEAVVSDAAKEWVLQRDTGGEAVGALREYLRVALEEMGPPLLELAAGREDNKPGTSGRHSDKHPVEMEADVHAAAREIAVAATTINSSQMNRRSLVTGSEGIHLRAQVERDEEASLARQTNRPNQCTISDGLLPSTVSEINQTMDKQKSAERDEDSIETQSSDRSQLPPPTNKKRVSDSERKKFVVRRKIKRWTPREEDALREAVKKHGSGNWKLILNCYSEDFKGRTEVDLKDKWRNLTRYKL